MAVVLYGCKTWSQVLMEERMQWMFENNEYVLALEYRNIITKYLMKLTCSSL
jgi:hypothetical protein